MIRHRNQPTWVYFIESLDPVGHIKIGCSRSPMSRHAQMRGWSPFGLTVLATMPGDETLERRFHALFLKDRTQGEWFRKTDQMEAVAAAVKAGTFDIAILPDGVDIRQREPRGDGLGPIAASISHRITTLTKRGEAVPQEIHDAATRFSNNPYRVGWDRKRDLRDAELALAWLNKHRPVPPHIVARFEAACREAA